MDFDSTEPQDDILPALPKLSSENKLLPNASPKIEIRWNKTWERHFVAKEDISPGMYKYEQNMNNLSSF